MRRNVLFASALIVYVLIIVYSIVQLYKIPEKKLWVREQAEILYKNTNFYDNLSRRELLVRTSQLEKELSVLETKQSIYKIAILLTCVVLIGTTTIWVLHRRSIEKCE